MKHAKLFLLGMGGMILLGGCDLGAGKLGVTGGDPVTYLCEQNQKVQVRYFSLSDESLNFVKLALPDGKDYTLPQAVSASGARYTDDHEVVWWNKDPGQGRGLCHLTSTSYRTTTRTGMACGFCSDTR